MEVLPIDVDTVLAALPACCAIGSSGDARLVVGPTGAFVLLPGGPDPLLSADRAGRLATTTRTALADHVSWVPFIDAIVVTSGRPPGAVAATPIPLDLLADVLVRGPEMIEADVLATVATLLDRGELWSWRTGLRIDDAKIDLCAPANDIASTS
jgi:hypothetical protein